MITEISTRDRFNAAPKSVLDSSRLGQVTWRSILGGKMPLQEMFLEKQLSDGRALVIKTYDANLAHDAFQHVGEDALTYVANALRLEELFEASDIPETSSPDYTDCDAHLRTGIRGHFLDHSPNYRAPGRRDR